MKYKTLDPFPIQDNVLKENTGLLFRICCLVVILFLSCIKNTFSQVERTDKLEEKQFKYFDLHYTSIKGENKLLTFATFYFGTGDYLRALPLYVELDQRYPGRIDFLYKAGICYLYKSDEKQKSIEYLDRVMKIDPTTQGLKFYLGKANHLNYRFDKAIQYFNDAIQNEGFSEIDKDFVKQLIKNCENGKKLVKNKLDVLIENIGPPINTEGAEYFPILSADESVLIFTYKGKKSTGGLQEELGLSLYFDDIFISKRSGDKWLEPEGISENINTREHDISVSLSADGKKLFIYKYTVKALGDIHISELDNNGWSTPVGLKGDVNSKYWEGSVSLSADGKTLYFSSERPDGYGNSDIYKSTLKSDGTWGKAVNLGPVINTKYNDEAPFIHADGKTLYFSSEGHYNMGGYDIFYSTIGDDEKWSVPENIGYPINTTDNDKYYVVLGDKKKAYYSSARSGGYGQQDIYVVYHDRPARKKKEKR